MASRSSSPVRKLTPEQELIEDMAGMSGDPWAWVMYSFPWGKGELEGKRPEQWQEDLLKRIRDGLINYQQAIQEAVASGHDVGKSALVAWIILWGISTFEDTRGYVTANTATQLLTKTWPELNKWHQMFIARHWFTLTATAIYSSSPAHERTWRIDAIPWSITNSEAFAGLHNHGKRIVIIFDEASAIADVIWDIADGATMDQDTEIIRAAFGNPTRNTGRFKDCFGRFKHRWNHNQVDARTVSLSNKTKIKELIEDYGVDSDYVRVRVRGVFPAASDRQFISSSLITPCVGRHLREDQYNFAPVILSCDPAWTGGDEVVIYLRQGLKSTMLAKYPKNDNDNEIAGFLAKFEDEHHADAVFIDLGYGTGIYSAGKLMSRKWTLVSFAEASTNPGFLNKRAEMWNLMKEWLKQGGALPPDPQIEQELTWPEGIPRLDGKVVLESKEDMRKRGLGSPNRADALALTFAHPVKRKAQNELESQGRLEFYNKRAQPVTAGRYRLYD